MPEVSIDIVPAPAYGATTASLGGDPSIREGVAVAVGGQWVGEKAKCVRYTKAGNPCSNVATVGIHCAGHTRAVAAEQKRG